MTVGELLRQADSRELTEWQAWQLYLAEVQGEKTDGRRIKWSED
jgi:hypothetical protein